MPARREPNFLFLLIGLLAVLVGAPVIGQLTDLPLTIITQLAFLTTLILGVWSLVDSSKWFIAGMVLAGSDVLFTILAVRNPDSGFVIATYIVELTFCILSLVFVIHHIFDDIRTDFNRIVGAVCAYLLLGVVFSLTNILIAEFLPGSYRGLTVSAEAPGFDMLYYSFVTMTTLGYGDITPTSMISKTVAYMSAVIGQFYIAILVAVLVSQYIAARTLGKET